MNHSRSAVSSLIVSAFLLINTCVSPAAEPSEDPQEQARVLFVGHSFGASGPAGRPGDSAVTEQIGNALDPQAQARQMILGAPARNLAEVSTSASGSTVALYSCRLMGSVDAQDLARRMILGLDPDSAC